jgi:hypothetical protein
MKPKLSLPHQRNQEPAISPELAAAVRRRWGRVYGGTENIDSATEQSRARLSFQSVVAPAPQSERLQDVGATAISEANYQISEDAQTLERLKANALREASRSEDNRSHDFELPA